jgi:IS5 family transposase
MKQLTLAAVRFDRYAKTTRRAPFLAEMERVVPWSALCALIEPFYPKPGNGRPPVGIERMLRLYFLQQWFNLLDPAVEEALYDWLAMRRFVDIDLGREPVPDGPIDDGNRILWHARQAQLSDRSSTGAAFWSCRRNMWRDATKLSAGEQTANSSRTLSASYWCSAARGLLPSPRKASARWNGRGASSAMRGPCGRR